MKVAFILLVFSSALLHATRLSAQNNYSLYGDIRIDESKTVGLRSQALDVILYTEGGMVLSRQTVSGNGRYRFNNLGQAIYVLSLESEGAEVARIRVDMRLPLLGEVRQDIEFAWKDSTAVVTYSRSAANQSLFEKSSRAANRKDYHQAIEFLLQIVKSDPRDFQAWTELGNNHYLMKNFVESENDYLRALDLQPKFLPALVNLGRLEVAQQKYEVAVDVLTRALEVKPDSAEVNYLLGESYLQVKRGSLAVKYLNDALRLDPNGMAEVHLRLATLYIRAGIPEKAVAEYEQFLKKRPGAPDRKNLESFIRANKSTK